jgi:iron complex outermembrane recepter protein
MILRCFFLCLTWLFLITVTLEAQSLRIRVADGQDTALIGANVLLMNADDKSRQEAFTDSEGKVVFSMTPAGTYQLTVSYIGYKSLDTTLVVPSPAEDIQIRLQEDVNVLGEVTVRSRRPLLRQDGDKTIVDPTPLLDVSTNSLELLEMTPGLFVDQDGAVYLSSASPAAVYINGREQRMSSQDIATLLRSLPPGSIERIELLRNPSARYDAASSGGIVNIVLKKGTKIGRFGSVNVGFNQGQTGNQFGGLNLNESNDKWSWYLNLNYNRDGSLQDLAAIRRSLAPFQLEQTTVTRRQSNNGFIGAGIRYDLSDNHQLSYDGRFSPNTSAGSTQGLNEITSLEGVFLATTDNQVKNFSTAYNQQHDLGYTWKLDTLGSALDIKTGIGFTQSTSEQDYTNLFLNSALDPEIGQGDLTNRRQFLQYQADYLQYLPWKMQVETGFKGSRLSFNGDAAFFTQNNGTQIPDPQRSNAYRYTESIHAAYLQATQTLPGALQLKAGLRAEQTDMRGVQEIPTDTSFSIRRIDWFPYVYLSRKIMAIAGFDLKAFAIYRKTLNRPGYQNLNPAIRILDQFNYESGNPALAPQFTDNYEVNVSMNDYPVFAVGQNYTQGIISQVLYSDAQNPEQTYQTYDNIGRSKESYFRITGGIPPVNRFFGVVGAQYNITEYDGLYENEPVRFRRGSWRIFTFQSLRIGKNTKIMASGFMLLNGQMNLMELGNFGQLNLTINHNFLDNKLQVSVFGRDILRTMNTAFSLQQSNIDWAGERYADNQRIGATLRYQFGIRPKEERKKSMLFPTDEG